MRLSLSSSGLKNWDGDVLVVGLLKEESEPHRAELSERFPGLEVVLEQQAFQAKPSDQVVLHPLQEGGPSRLIVLGLGEAAALSLDGLRAAAARAAKASIGCSGSLGLLLPC